MTTDPRISTLRYLINKNLVPTFGDLFEHIPTRVVAKLMGMNYYRMVMLKKNPRQITVEEIDRLSELIGVEMKKVWKLVEKGR